MRRTLLGFALAMVVVTAGCGGFPAGGGTPTASSPGTVSPTGTATGTPAPLPASVSADGIENTTALFRGNEEALDGTPYVLETRTNLTFFAQGESVTQRVESTVRSEGADGARVQQHVFNHTLQGDALTEVWSNGTVTLVRTWQNASRQREPSVSYRSAPSPEAAQTGQTGSQATFILVSLGTFEVTDRSPSGVTLTATGVNRTALERALGEGASVEAFSAELVVDASGRIASFDGSMVATPGENSSASFDSVAIHGDWTLTTTEDVTVDRPDWVPEGMAAATVVNVSIDVADDGRYATVTNEGPDAVPAGFLVTVKETGTSFGGAKQLSEPLEPGESVYVYRSGEGDLVVSREQPEEVGSPLSGSFHLTIQTRSRVLVDRTFDADGG